MDAAFITAGVEAPVFHELLSTHECDLIDLPYARALATKHSAITEYTIPAGLYRAGPDAIPVADVHTVAYGAQLLTRADVPSDLVQKVAQTVLGEEFLKENRLGELIAGGLDFASQKPEFAIHSGAEGIYNPHLRPLLDPDFVDECFVQMCHALSDKINAKISRQRIDRGLCRIAEKLDRGEPDE